MRRAESEDEAIRLIDDIKPMSRPAFRRTGRFTSDFLQIGRHFLEQLFPSRR